MLKLVYLHTILIGCLLSFLFGGCYTHVPDTYIPHKPIVRVSWYFLAFELFPEIFLLCVLATAALLTVDDVDGEEGIGSE